MGSSVNFLFDRGTTGEEAGIAAQHSLLSLYKWYLVLLGLLVSHDQGSSSVGLLDKYILVRNIFQDLGSWSDTHWLKEGLSCSHFSGVFQFEGSFRVPCLVLTQRGIGKARVPVSAFC